MESQAHLHTGMTGLIAKTDIEPCGLSHPTGLTSKWVRHGCINAVPFSSKINDGPGHLIQELEHLGRVL